MVKDLSCLEGLVLIVLAHCDKESTKEEVREKNNKRVVGSKYKTLLINRCDPFLGLSCHLNRIFTPALLTLIGHSLPFCIHTICHVIPQCH